MTDIFRTDDNDPNKLKNSSYLDLSPLYGNSDDLDSDGCVGKVRTYQDGKLKPDTINESRVYGLPPGVAVLLICFNRFHNYVASQLKEINEGNRFSPRPHQSKEEAEKRVDEDLFQTARLITCGLYVNIILHDYVRTILNLQTTDSPWTLDPRTDCESIFDQHGVPSGIGNQASVEFNMVYRWHSSISERDARWTESLYSEIFNDDDIYPYLESPVRFYARAGPWFARIKAQNPEDRELRDLRRNAEGRYNDSELVDILTDSTKDVAGAFGPKNVPLVMKLIETMGIEQARKWNVCTLNELRKFFKLEPHRKFTDITSNEQVARTLETLYSRPDYVELYPGLIAEDAKDSLEPGAGLCPGYTTSRTILADAVTLIRSDRFYTVVSVSQPLQVYPDLISHHRILHRRISLAGAGT
jgi:Animal haem peroxidase